MKDQKEPEEFRSGADESVSEKVNRHLEADLKGRPWRYRQKVRAQVANPKFAPALIGFIADKAYKALETRLGEDPLAKLLLESVVCLNMAFEEYKRGGNFDDLVMDGVTSQLIADASLRIAEAGGKYTGSDSSW